MHCFCSPTWRQWRHVKMLYDGIRGKGKTQMFRKRDSLIDRIIRLPQRQTSVINLIRYTDDIAAFRSVRGSMAGLSSSRRNLQRE